MKRRGKYPTTARRHVEMFVTPLSCTPGLFEAFDAVAASGVFLFAAAAPFDLFGMPGGTVVHGHGF